MRYCAGIDLGSTTTKAVVLDEAGRMIGRGITNSRSDYEVACQVALSEALIGARFGLLEAALGGGMNDAANHVDQRVELERRLRCSQYLAQLAHLRDGILALCEADAGTGDGGGQHSAAEDILAQMRAEAADLYAPGASRKSDFFRDLAGSRYLSLAERAARRSKLSYDRLAGLFDKAILDVESRPPADQSFGEHAHGALSQMRPVPDAFVRALDQATCTPLEQAATVGTGYGRATLPFPKSQIRSEILCHGLGAHTMFPGTRTVLDIGGQDTKAIQVDEQGIVTSFQMNDRCAAGCGRYLGYIADEMNLGLHELGPMACSSQRRVRINSTCTVFAGAELRERLFLGEKREDILAGLHRAIILRAMSLLARSGGVMNEFTFTGGVAKNPAAVSALTELVRESYGDVHINISPDSIYTGALGAALFAHRGWKCAAA